MTTTWREIATLGGSQQPVSRVGLGCNSFGARISGADVDSVVNTALDAGVTHFDTADVYAGGESERELGRALAGRRDEALIATKFGARPIADLDGERTSPRAVRLSCERSLSRLGTDVIDIYYMHKPDGSVPISETLSALSELVDEGKVRYVACSNFAPSGLVEADMAAKELGASRFLLHQTEWNLLARDAEAELVPVSEDLEVGSVPYYPLASGLLTGKYEKGGSFPAGTRLAEQPQFRDVATSENFDRAHALNEFAESRGHTLVELALSWLGSRSTVASVIVGATRAEQVAENVRSAEWSLSPQEMEEFEIVWGGAVARDFSD